MTRNVCTIGCVAVIILSASGCTSRRPIYDTQGRFVGYREEFDPGKTLMVLGFGLSGMAASGLAQNAAAAADAHRLGRGLL